MSSRKSKAEGVDATNRDYIDYEEVRKDQVYSLSEGSATPSADSAERFDDELEIRTCDIGRFLHGDEAERAAFSSELGAALREIGFAILVGHGVDPELYLQCERAVVRLFTGHSIEEKLRFRAARHGSVNQGYFPIEETTEIHPDLVEGWVFCRRAFDLDGSGGRARELWPKPEYERTFRPLCVAHEALIRPVMQSILTYLGCDPHLFDKKLGATNFGLRLNYYPPLATGSKAGRLLGHEDVDLFTLLPAPTIEGLQVLNRRNFRWVRLQAPPGSIILNTGDYMQRLSNDVLPSTTHRVSQPRDAAARTRARVSFPFNVYLWEDEMLEVLPGLENPHYEPIRAEEFHTRITSKYYGDAYAKAVRRPAARSSDDARS